MSTFVMSLLISQSELLNAELYFKLSKDKQNEFYDARVHAVFISSNHMQSMLSICVT